MKISEELLLGNYSSRTTDGDNISMVVDTSMVSDPRIFWSYRDKHGHRVCNPSKADHIALQRNRIGRVALDGHCRAHRAKGDSLHQWKGDILHLLRGEKMTICLNELYGETAKLEELPGYVEKAKKLAGEGEEVIITGQAPIWLYLKVAHALHGKVKKLFYSSPVTGEIEIFNHNPF